MSGAGVRIGVGTRVMYDGAVHEVTEWLPTVSGTDVVLRGPNSVCRMSVVELVSGSRVRLLIDTLRPGIHRSDGSGSGGVVESAEKETRRGPGEGRTCSRGPHRVPVGKQRDRRGRRTARRVRSQPPAVRPLCRQGRRARRRRTHDSPLGQGIRGERRGRFGFRTVRPTEQDRPTVERSSAGHHA